MKRKSKRIKTSTRQNFNTHTSPNPNTIILHGTEFKDGMLHGYHTVVTVKIKGTIQIQLPKHGITQLLMTMNCFHCMLLLIRKL